MNEMEIEKERPTKLFLSQISENNMRIVFQLHSDPPFIYRSFSLNGTRPHIHIVLDYLSGQIGRDLKYIFDFNGNRWRISFADYIK
jgi:hypothetical protein